MNDATIWWLVTGVLVAAELMTGTFYLLMLTIGAVAAALTAHMGGSLTVQLVTAALIGGLLSLSQPVVAQALPPAECGYGGRVQPCRITPTAEGLTVLLGAGGSTPSLDIPAQHLARCCAGVARVHHHRHAIDQHRGAGAAGILMRLGIG